MAEVNFVGPVKATNKLSPVIQAITIQFPDKNHIKLPTGQSKLLTGKTTRLVAGYEDGTEKRFDAASSRDFNDELAVTFSCRFLGVVLMFMLILSSGGKYD